MRSAIFLLAALIASAAQASSDWTLTDAQFSSRRVAVESMDAAGIHLAAAAATQPSVVPWDDVLWLSHPAASAAPSTGRFMLYLRSGDRLAGESVALNNDVLQWNASRMGQIDFSVNRVLALSRGQVAAADLETSHGDDVVRLANGDVAHGIITRIDASGVTLQADDGTPTLSWDAVAAVFFSTPPGAPAQANQARLFRVQLTGNESLCATGLSLAGDRLTIQLEPQTSRAIDLSSVAGIEQLNGPVSWLTAHKPAENIYRPFFTENFPTRFDRTVADDRPVSEKYPGFHHGIGCHSYSKLVYELDGRYAGFRTQFAVDSDSPLANVTVRIYLDDKVVLQQKNVQAGPIHPVVTIRLGQAKTLALEVGYGPNYATEGRFVWLDPALIRVLPPTTQP